jgi:hypothetical protein
LTTQIVTDQISGANSIHHVPSRHSTPWVTASAHGKLLPPGPVMVPVFGWCHLKPRRRER